MLSKLIRFCFEWRVLTSCKVADTVLLASRGFQVIYISCSVAWMFVCQMQSVDFKTQYLLGCTLHIANDVKIDLLTEHKLPRCSPN